MDVAMIIKVAGIGVLVAVATQVLAKSGRDEQVMMVTVTGILVALGFIIGKLGELFSEIAQIFGL
ncbi:MAG: stage III sporulation protein AC [Clostridia bacterium]|nr:stage III sporulation protein AC [Clostridia bacterium]